MVGKIDQTMCTISVNKYVRYDVQVIDVINSDAMGH